MPTRDTTLTDRPGAPTPRRDGGRWVAPVLPSFFGRYLLLERLGRGGMGVVYRAAPLDRGSAPDVALKILTSHLRYPETAERFSREIAALASLTHPAIVRVHDHGRWRGQPYYAMELVRGVNLRQLSEEQGPQPAERVRRILERLADAVRAAHRAGLIHRDLKPSNVMVDPAAPCRTATLLDFGLVYESGRPPGERITLEDMLLGTPGYLAPEGMQSSRALGPPADVYGLGLIGAHLLLGRPVYAPADLVAPEAHRAATDRALAEFQTAPASLRAALAQTLTYRPEDRPTLPELRDALRAVSSPTNPA